MAEERKKMLNTNSNTYIIIYSAIMVIIVAFLLAFIFKALKPAQDINVALDKKKQILASLNIRDLDNQLSASKYSEVVIADNIIDSDGNIISEGSQGGEEAGFTLDSSDYKEGQLALYICDVDGEIKYVVSVYGMGLWGPIWGFVAVNDDCQTVFGAYFNHDSETAGLGAEIKDSRTWQEQFQGKSIYSLTEDGSLNEAILAVCKKVDNQECQVDGVTGATLTCNGVTSMLKEGFTKYKGFMSKVKNVEVKQAEEAIKEEEELQDE